MPHSSRFNSYHVEKNPLDISKESLESLSPETLENGHRKLVESIENIEAQFGDKLGNAKEAHIAHVDTASFPITGFSERKISDEQLEVVAKTYKHFVDVVGIDNADQMNISMAVTPGASVEEGSRVLANADQKTGVIRFSEDIFTTELRGKQSIADTQKNVGDVDAVTATLMHELGHTVEFAAMQQLGNSRRLIADFLGDTGLSANFRRKSYDIADATVIVPKDGEYTQAIAKDHYGDASVIERPSDYARVKHGEYFAEVFMTYALKPENLPQPLHDFMKHVIDQQLFVKRNPNEHTPPAFIEDVF